MGFFGMKRIRFVWWAGKNIVLIKTLDFSCTLGIYKICFTNMPQFQSHWVIVLSASNVLEERSIPALGTRCWNMAGILKRKMLSLSMGSTVPRANHRWLLLEMVSTYYGSLPRVPSSTIRFFSAYLSRGDYNVFTVDWSILTFFPCYLSSLSNSRLVAQCTAHFYSHLTYNGASAYKILCVGHSLGAHICGMMTNHLSHKMHKIIGKWTVAVY